MSNFAENVGKAVIALALGLSIAVAFYSVGFWIAMLHKFIFIELGASPLTFVIGMGLSASPFLYFYYLSEPS